MDSISTKLLKNICSYNKNPKIQYRKVDYILIHKRLMPKINNLLINDENLH